MCVSRPCQYRLCLEDGDEGRETGAESAVGVSRYVGREGGELGMLREYCANMGCS